MLDARVILPTSEHFPDPYDGTPATAESFFRHVCTYMRVGRGQVDFEIFPHETEDLRNALPYWSGSSKGCAGLYVHEPSSNGSHVEEKLGLVAIRSTQLKDPLSLVASIAHELGHVILIGGGLIDSNIPDHGPLLICRRFFLDSVSSPPTQPRDSSNTKMTRGRAGPCSGLAIFPRRLTASP